MFSNAFSAKFSLVLIFFQCSTNNVPGFQFFLGKMKSLILVEALTNVPAIGTVHCVSQSRPAEMCSILSRCVFLFFFVFICCPLFSSSCFFAFAMLFMITKLAIRTSPFGMYYLPLLRKCFSVGGTKSKQQLSLAAPSHTRFLSTGPSQVVINESLPSSVWKATTSDHRHRHWSLQCLTICIFISLSSILPAIPTVTASTLGISSTQYSGLFCFVNCSVCLYIQYIGSFWF